jgi:hypothetical protein
MIIKTHAVHALGHDWPKIDNVKKALHTNKLKLIKQSVNVRHAGQKFNLQFIIIIFLSLLKIRRLWNPKKVILQHRCLICRYPKQIFTFGNMQAPLLAPPSQHRPLRVITEACEASLPYPPHLDLLVYN